MKKIVILDQALLTDNGVFEFRDLKDYEVKEIVTTALVESHIRFPSVANVISKHLGITIEPVKKEECHLLAGDKAIVFVLNKPKGLLNLNSEKIRKAGFGFKLLSRIS